ncbi:ribosome-associated translation inhibitor RaiA [Spiroplasma endosymbiont of Anurida maritima]|uniref:ribosome hibernation-promoting factor, HPF/YfiA family n=1 Tax=Spiroplasma endosymbiont of Anurida maritima TaxID=2967972 RepID=UPI0036D329E2
MNFNVRNKNIEVTDGMKTHYENMFLKLTKFKEFHNDDIVHLDIEYNKVDFVINASIDIIGKNHFLKATIKDNDFYNAIDKIVDKLLDQIKKIKEIKTDKKHKQSFAKTIDDSMENEIIE